MIVNTSANVVGTVEGTKPRLRSGDLDYLSFERKVEKITFNNNVAVVMGGEIIKPHGQQVNAGKTVSRRFTGQAPNFSLKNTIRFFITFNKSKLKT